MADHDDLISQFKTITQETVDDRAKFFLETANWQLDLAVASYYDNGGDENMETVDTVPPQNIESPTISTGASTVPTDDDYNRDDGLDAWMRTQNSAAENKPKEKKTTEKAKKPTKYASLSDYASAPAPDSDEEEGQQFYAGGSEHSGELIVGPGKKKKDGIVKQMFQDAKKHGAETVDRNDRLHEHKPKQSTSHFSGSGYKLGSTDTDHEFLPSQEKPQERRLDIVLKFWKNGFTIGDDGPLRDFKDNKEFLDHIKKGEVPPELSKLAKGGVVNVDMEDNSDTEFVEAKKKLKPFTGEGRKLGSAAPTVITNNAPPQVSSVDPEVIVNTSEPVTTLQIRLADGTKVTQKFNHTHTVADVRSLMLSRNPQSQTRSFVLMTTFPNKELTDMSTTLKDANLLNTVIVQRYK